MLHTTPARFAWTFLVGYLVASQLNWGIAELFLNDWATPRFDGFMRMGDDARAGVGRMVVGFLLPQFVACLLAVSLAKPAGAIARAIYAALLVGVAGFFGTYTFLSGWGNVNWVPLMGAAVADTSCLVIGNVVAAALQGWRRAPATVASRA